MTDTVDVMQIVQDLVFAALNAAIPADLALVRVETLENQQPPLVIVGDMDAQPEGGKGGHLDLITIDVQSISRGSGRRGLLAIMKAVRDALDDQQLEADGANLSTLSFKSAGTARGADGVTYAGITQFEIFAEPA